MSGIKDEIRRFRQRKAEEASSAASWVAFNLIAGVDLHATLAAPSDEKARVALRVRRLLERERLRGLRRHWSYDVNRHIALKRAFDLLTENGARKRRTAPEGAVPKPRGPRSRS